MILLLVLSLSVWCISLPFQSSFLQNVLISAYSLNNFTQQWCHNTHDSVSNHQPYDCLHNRLFRRRSKKASKLRVTGLCEENSPGTGQMASNAENVSIWWRHHDYELTSQKYTSEYILGGGNVWQLITFNHDVLPHNWDLDSFGTSPYFAFIW